MSPPSTVFSVPRYALKHVFESGIYSDRQRAAEGAGNVRGKKASRGVGRSQSAISRFFSIGNKSPPPTVVARKATIFTQDELANSIFYLQSGKVKLSVVNENGKEAIIALLGADHFIGEGCLAGQQRRIATATAMTGCQIVSFEKSAFCHLLDNNHEFSAMFMSHVLKENARLEDELINHFFNSTEKRLARLLLLLASTGKEGLSGSIDAKISQESLAGMIGTTRPRVSQFMNKFRRLGLIEYGGHLKVHASLLNVVLETEKPTARPPAIITDLKRSGFRCGDTVEGEQRNA
jgi:CRP/FNR family cyclic AMP-dependent transcriptional regulator